VLLALLGVLSLIAGATRFFTSADANRRRPVLPLLGTLGVDYFVTKE
jgi:hypothetical protein